MQNFWFGKKVFVTGHTGFKGSWLSLWLQYLGADVTGYALASPTCPSLFELAQVNKGMNSVEGDIRDIEKLKNELLKSKAEIVFHMAALPLVLDSYINPVETYSTNVMGTVNLFEAIRSCESIISVVNVTTDKCYENQELIRGYKENDILGGFDPYSNSKACSELITSAYRSAFFGSKPSSIQKVYLASARAGNVVGGGDWSKHRLIPDIIKSIETGDKIFLRNPNSIRPWQHVLDSLNGYMILAQKLFENGNNFAEAWNFGPLADDAKSVAWITEKMIDIWGSNSTWFSTSFDSFHESTFLTLDTSKSQQRLNWHPRLTIENSLTFVVDWAKDYYHKKNIKETTINQIIQFQSLL